MRTWTIAKRVMLELFRDKRTLALIFKSTFAASEFQMMQFIPIIVMPQVFFSGIIPLDSMASWVQVIGKILPLTYVGDAMFQIIMYGKGLGDIWVAILALLIFLAVLLAANILGLKRYLKYKRRRKCDTDHVSC